MCVGAMADQIVGQYTLTSTGADCWVSELGVIYAINSATADGTMEVYGLSKAANGTYEPANVVGDDVPIWDGDAENVELEILTYVNGQSVTRVEGGVFNGQTCITKLIIPQYINTIGKQAFYNLQNCTVIYCYATTPPDISGDSVFGMSSSTGGYTATVYVPYGTKSLYEADDPTKASYRGWGYYSAQNLFTYVEMEEGETGPTIEGYMDVTPESGSTVKGSLESITLSYEGGVTLYDEKQFPILIYSTSDASEAVASLMYNDNSAQTDGTYILYVYDAEGTTQQALDSYDDFTLTIPENTFTLGEGTETGNVAETLYYTVEDDTEYTITISPENGTETEESISDFTISCEDGLAVVIAPNTFSNKIYVYKDGVVTDNFILEDENGTGTSHTFYFDTALSAQGTYTVTFPAGAFRVGPYNQLSDEMTITYTITTDADEYSEIVWSPDNTSALNELSDITIYNYLDEDRGTSRIKLADAEKISITDEAGTSYTFTAADGTNNSYVTITLDEPINAKGTYTLKAEAGAFLLGTTETDSEEIEIAYDIANYDITFTPDGTSSMRSLATFTINCEDGIILEPNDDEGYDNLTITKDGDTEIYAQVVPDPTPASDGSYTFTIYDADGTVATPLTEDGEYVVGVPKNYFSLGDEKIGNAATTCTYIISADANIDTFTYDPADGATVEQLDTISITNGEDGLTVVCEDPSVIIVTNEAGETVTTCKAIEEDNEDEEGLDTEIKLILNDEIDEEGTYKVVIPAGIIYYGTTSNTNDKITLTYTVEPPTPLFSTQFTNWYDLAEEDAIDKVIPVVTSTKGNFTFTLNGVRVDKDDVSQWNTGDDGEKTTPKFEGEGALIFGKSSSTEDVYYVETSVLGSVDKIKFTEAVTGSNRGAKLLVKGYGDSDWVTLYETTMNTGSQDVKVNVNRTNCQIRFENLAYNQNVYILGLKIYGTDGEEMTFDTALEIDPETGSQLESLESFSISYADGIELDNSTLQGYVFNEKGAKKAIFDFTKNSENNGVQTSYNIPLYDIDDPETPAALTADGTYTISIDEGAFRLGIYDESIDNADKETTEPIEITYIIGTGVSAKTEDFVLTPENGVTELTELSEFTASCEMGIALTDEDLALEVTVGNTVVAIAKYVEGDEITDNDGTIGYAIKFYDPETGEAITLTDEATYSFTIPAGTFVYGSNNTESEEIVIYYTIGELWFTFVPSDGSTVSSLESVSVTNGLEGVGLRYLPYPKEGSGEPATGLIVVLDEKNDTVTTVPNYDYYVEEIWDENNPDDPDQEVIFIFERPVVTAGTYTVVIPANIIFQGKRDVDSTGDIYLTITVDGTEDGSDAYQLYIELDDSALGDNSSLEEVWATIQEDYPESVEGLEETYEAISAEIATLRVDLLASYKAGTLEDEASEFEAQIAAIKTEIDSLLETASGINGITTDANSFEGKGVYTISGQKVSAPTKAGIYIIDGKKVVIK